ncbi:head GIN domain-containing protein [Chloroflexota bacterium]
MKNLAFAVLAGIVLISGLIAGCQGVVFGSGDPETRTFDLTGFTRVEAHNGFQIEITQSSTFGVEVTTDDNVWKYLDVEKSGDILVISFDWNRSYSAVIKEAVITMPEIEGIQLSGGSQGEITGFSSSRDFRVKLSGGSGLDGAFSTGDTEINMSGGSRVTLTGSGENLVIYSSGGSKADLEDFSVYDSDITISGGGSADINMVGVLDANLSGGSRVRYTGSVEIGDLQLSGSSTISKK